jgi:hypothetical protein
MSQFTKSENIELLWEILLDEPFKNVPKEEYAEYRNSFNNELRLFYNTQIVNNSNSTDLFTLNQQFLSKIIQQYTNQEPIHKTNTVLYKAEDIQTDRINQFEMQLSQKRQEFDSAITLKKPPLPNFADTSNKSEHIPINEMEALIAQTLAQRNLEIEKIHKSNINNTTTPTNWLKPQETSIKTENNENNQTAIKYIKIGREQLPALTDDIIDISEKTDKKISWADENITPPVSNIFSKLKLKSNTDTNTTPDFQTQIDNLTERIAKLENIIERLK